jgi:CubicO group peptidase (beta-lactamase class C family)
MVFCTDCTEKRFFVHSDGVADGMDHFENFDEKPRVDNGDYDSGVNGIIAAGNIESEVELKFCSGGVDLDTPFFIGSISKQFAGVLALRHIPHLLESDVTTLLGEEEFTSLINSRWEAEKSWDGLTLKHLARTTIRDLLTNSSKIDYRSGEDLGGYKKDSNQG